MQLLRSTGVKVNLPEKNHTKRKFSEQKARITTKPGLTDDFSIASHDYGGLEESKTKQRLDVLLH